MITEIEMLKKRVAFLEKMLFGILTKLDNETEHRTIYSRFWLEFYKELEAYEEQYKTNVVRVGCRECMENNQ
jgi:hypothetical protein